MSGFTYQIAVNVTGGNKVSATTAAVQKLDAAVDAIPGSAAVASNSLVNMANRGAGGVARLESTLAGMAARLGGVALVANSLQKALQADSANRAITFAGGQEGARNVAFVNEAVDKLGLDLAAAREGFKGWSGALRGTKMAGAEGRAIFYSVAEATSAMGVSAEGQKGTFIALSQMLSKGKISAEELRGQLGEHLPGAFGIAARAMGVTESKLNKMLETGQVVSEEFLPRFARQLHAEMGGAAANAANSAAANVNRFFTALTNVQVALAEQLLPTMTSWINDTLIPGMKWVKENAAQVYAWGKAILAGVVVMKVWSTSMAIGAAVSLAYATATATSGTATTIFGKAMALTNLILAANPIGLVVLALGALASAFVWAYNTSDNFRGMMQGIVQVVIDMTQRIWNLVTGPLSAAFKILSGDMDGARKDAEAWNKAARGMTGAGLAASYNRGWNRAQTKADAAAKSPSAVDEAQAALNSPFASSASPAGASTTQGGDLANNSSIKSGIGGITGGGPQNRVINLGQLVGELNINSATVEQGSDAMVNMLMQKLLQVLNSSNQTQ